MEKKDILNLKIKCEVFFSGFMFLLLCTKHSYFNTEKWEAFRYVLKYNFCTVLCVIEEHLGPEVDVEERDEKMELVEVDHQATRAVKSSSQETNMDVQLLVFKEQEMPKCRHTRFYYYQAGELF